MRTTTIQPTQYQAFRDARGNHAGYKPRGAEIRLRGLWVRKYFTPGQRVRVVPQMQGKKIVLVLESL